MKECICQNITKILSASRKGRKYTPRHTIGGRYITFLHKGMLISLLYRRKQMDRKGYVKNGGVKSFSPLLSGIPSSPKISLPKMAGGSCQDRASDAPPKTPGGVFFCRVFSMKTFSCIMQKNRRCSQKISFSFVTKYSFIQEENSINAIDRIDMGLYNEANYERKYAELAKSAGRCQI